jgi:hypothetical protein
MNRTPTAWLLPIVFAPAIALPLAACGAAEDATPALTPEQLPEMILQREDLPAGLSYQPRPGSPPEPEWGDPETWLGGYGLAAYLPHSVAKPGDLVCISAGLALYDSVAAAKEFWKQGHEWLQQLRQTPPPGEAGWIEISVPSLADQSAGYFLSTRSNLCLWEDTQMEAVMVHFRKGRLWAGVFTATLEHGASPDEAVELARKQLARIDAALGQ